MTRLLPLLVVAAACATPQDFGETGIRIFPAPGPHDAPIDLKVVNTTDGDVVCQVLETDLCPSLGDQLEPLDLLEPGDRWVVQDVTCVELDVTCLPADFDETTRPLRVWTWQVLDEDTTTLAD